MRVVDSSVDWKRRRERRDSRLGVARARRLARSDAWAGLGLPDDGLLLPLWVIPLSLPFCIEL